MPGTLKLNNVVFSHLAVAKIGGDSVKLSLMQNGVIKISTDKQRDYPIVFHLIQKQLPDMKKKKGDDSGRATPELESSIPGDYSRAKAPPNQIPIAQFWGFCEQYLRNLTEDDMAYLSTPVNHLI